MSDFVANRTTSIQCAITRQRAWVAKIRRQGTTSVVPISAVFLKVRADFSPRGRLPHPFPLFGTGRDQSDLKGRSFSCAANSLYFCFRADFSPRAQERSNA
jgi:hypothetical protein